MCSSWTRGTEGSMDVGLYLHFPFCWKKCAYCDFLSAPADEDTKKLYAAAIIREIRGYAKTLEGRTVTSVYLGGGTPSLMPAGALRDIFRVLCDTFDIAPDAEITMEMNPGTVNERIAAVAYDYVNRVSLGVQSAVDPELKALGRIHTRAEAEKSFRMLRDHGARNISVDLMTGIPLQTPESLGETLKFVLDLNPEHVSCYSLIVEEGTKFHRLQEAGRLELPDEETERLLVHTARETLEAAGFLQYEISNFAKEGFECRHNIRYWRRGDYIGFGIGAASLFQHTRWRNSRNLRRYLSDSADPGRIVREMEQLSLKDEVEEFMFLGLRTRQGVSSEVFRETFSLELGDIYGEKIGEFTRQGLLEPFGDDGIRLTVRGIDVSNIVMSAFLLDQGD